MSVFDTPIAGLTEPDADYSPKPGMVTLIVNVASECGFTPQYEGLERLQSRFAASGFTVLGVPCNQFGGQEPGTADEIAEFCSVKYGVSFPLTEKVDVNGANRHPLYKELVDHPDANGYSGDIRWNFEKFVIDGAGDVIARFSTKTEPEDEGLVAVIMAALPDVADSLPGE